MRFAVEAWAPEYGVGADEQALTDVTAPVDPGVEVAPADWRPQTPVAAPAPRVVFVDGVRRIDARIWIDDGRGRSWSGVCASVGAGAVAADETGARVVDHRVRRLLVVAAGAEATPITTRHGRYDVVTAAGDDPDAQYLAIHDRMTALELDLRAGEVGDVVVFDGPLRGRADPDGVGYVKTQRVQYLDEALAPTVAALDAGQRTPLFLIGGPGGLARFSAYLRLPGPRSHPWSGIVRLELPATMGTPAAAARIDVVAATLPRFASQPHKEPRAPQNLYPIAGLEHRLRHLLGDALVLERALRLAAAA